jgi:hypothetical protein
MLHHEGTEATERAQRSRQAKPVRVDGFVGINAWRVGLGDLSVSSVPPWLVPIGYGSQTDAANYSKIAAEASSPESAQAAGDNLKGQRMRRWRSVARASSSGEGR